VEIFNEFCVVACAHMSNLFLNDALPEELKGSLGWEIIGVASTAIVVNLLITIGVFLKDLVMMARRQMAERVSEKAMQKRLTNRKYLTQNFKGRFPQF